MLRLRLEGRTYEYIANKAGVSRQRVQQIISPPKEVRKYVVDKYNGRCTECGLYVGYSGHVHHEGANGEEDYNDIENLQLLCISCHGHKHNPSSLPKAKLVPHKRLPQPSQKVTLCKNPTLIQVLKYIQTRDGLNNEEFSKKIGIHEVSWSRIRNYKKGLGEKTLRGLRRAFPELKEAIDSYWKQLLSENPVTPQGLLKRLIHKFWGE